MQILYIGNKGLVFGMTWRAYDPLESRHSQITAWKGDGYVWQSSYKLDADTVVGLCKDDLEETTSGERRFSGAALIARHPDMRGRTTLAMLAVNDEDAVFVGLISGNVVIDEIAAKSDESRIRNRFALDVKTTNQESGSFHSDLKWDDVANIRGGALGAYYSEAKIAPFQSDRGSWILVGLLVLGLLSMSGFWLKKQYDEEKIRKQQTAEKLASDPRTVYEISINKFLGNPTAIAPVGPAVTEFRKAINDMGDVYRAGWVFQNGECVVETKSCLVSWTRISPNVGTFEGFIKSAPTTWKSITFDAGLNQILVTLPVVVPLTAFAPRAKWPTLQELLATEGSRWQTYAPVGFSVSLKEAIIQGLPIGVQPSAVAAAPAAVFAAVWEVSSRPLFLAEILEKTQQPNMTLDSLRFVFTGNEIQFAAKGKIYVRQS